MIIFAPMPHSFLIRITWALQVLAGLSISLPAYCAADYGLAPKPAWVVPAPFLDKRRRQAIDGEFARFFMSDTQVNLAPQVQRYFHYAARALNAEGIQQLSKLTLSFDPRTEQLDVHDLSLLREGKRIPLLRNARVSVSTTDNATRQVTFWLDNVKRDDVLDYQYTLTALNKSTAQYAAIFNLRWPVPVDRAQVRILFPSTRKLEYRVFNLKQAPQRNRRGASNEIVLLLDNVPPRQDESNTPTALVNDVQLQISEYTSWDEVQARLNAQYPRNEPLPPALEALATQWAAKPLPQEAALAALDYVQREIETRPGDIAQPPSALTQILAQRSGNARDKAHLLLSVLGRMQIEAYPALVSASRHQGVNAFLPAPDLFDHLVVLTYLDGEPYWLDPTRRYQAGDLAARSAAQYRNALVLDDNTGGMTDMVYPTDFAQRITVRQQFRVTDYRAPVEFDIQTEYQGAYAEKARALLAGQSPKLLSQARAQQMTRFYPKLQVVEPGLWQDDQARNIVLVTERYVIPDFFDYADGYFVSRYFVSQEALPLLRATDQPSRATAFALAYPFAFLQTTEVKLPAPISEKPIERREINNPHLNFSATRLQQSNLAKFDYQLQGRREWVLPESLAQYQTAIQNIRENLSQTLELTTATPSEIQRIYASYPAVNAGSLDVKDVALYQEAARIQAAIESGLLTELQRPRALRQFNALQIQLNLPPRTTEAVPQ